MNDKDHRTTNELELLYHVTPTKNVSKIRAQGLRRFQPSHWVKAGSGERYGNGEVFAFEHWEDAVCWAVRMDWGLNKTTGSGKVSILWIMRQGEWEADDSDSLSQLGAKGLWFKSHVPVPPDCILSHYPVTVDIVQQLVKAAPL